MNQALALEVIGRLRGAGAHTWCLCPGGRNAPLVEALEHCRVGGLEVLDFFDERAAAFFALGRARRDRRPVAVVTTSGTAAAELLPAIIEAAYSGAPLVAVTADRPPEYRGTGAPQTIEQPGLFGVYAGGTIDLSKPRTGWELPPIDGPVHVNVSFDEPLLAGWTEVADGEAPAPRGVRREADAGAAPEMPGHAPLVLLGAIQSDDDQQAVAEFCTRLAAPVLAEASSHLVLRLGDLVVRGGEAAVRRGFDRGLFDSVVRVGGIPSCRLWRDLETKTGVPVASVSRTRWRGLTRGHHVHVPGGLPLASGLPRIHAAFPDEARREIAGWDRALTGVTDRLLDEFPTSEPSLVRLVSRAVPAGSFVYLGNSAPIREWNQFSRSGDASLRFGENRGANGIDGQLSSFLGQAAPGRENWAIVGDLTALYDLSSPWALRYVPAPARIVIVNNRGGRIFERMFGNPRFQNRHDLGFEAWARMWGLEYASSIPGAWGAPASIVELRPDDEQTAAFWKALDEKALA